MSAHYAKLRLHTYDDFDPPHPGTFLRRRLNPPDHGATRSWWVPQTIGDQIWVFVEFADEAARDAYLAAALAAFGAHVTSHVPPIASDAFVPDAETVAHWCTDGDYVRRP